MAKECFYFKSETMHILVFIVTIYLNIRCKVVVMLCYILPLGYIEKKQHMERKWEISILQTTKKLDLSSSYDAEKFVKDAFIKNDNNFVVR